MAQYFPPVRSQDEPEASLDDNPCLDCKSLHEMLVVLVFLMAAYTSAGTPAELEVATRKFRGMSRPEMVHYMIEQFSDELIATATPEAIACLKCYSDQKLMEMFVYLTGLLLQVP